MTFKLDFPGNLWLAAFAILSNLDAPFIMKEIALPGCKFWENHCCDSLHFDSEDMYEDNFTKSWLKVFLIWVDLSTMMEKLFPKMPKLPTTTWEKQTREGKLWGKQTSCYKKKQLLKHILFIFILKWLWMEYMFSIKSFCINRSFWLFDGCVGGYWSYWNELSSFEIDFH